MPATVSGIKAGKAFVLIEAVDRTGKVLDGIRNKMGRWASQMSSIGTTIALRSAAALTPTVMATSAFSDFDDVMRRIESRTPGVASDMAGIRKQAMQLSQTMGAFSPSEVGALQEILAVRGFDRGQILQSTEAILRLARAAGEGKDLMLDASTAAQLVAGSLASFGLKADSAAGFADALSVAANASNYTLEELVTSLSYAAPAASEFGVSLEETLSVLAAMRDLNIDASIAGTAFRNMLKYASQGKEQDKFNEKLQALTGNVIQFTDAAGNLKHPTEMLLAIAKATEGLGTAQRSELYTDLFETRASTPAAAVGRSTEAIARMQAALANAGGEVKRISEFMEGGLGGALRRIRAAAYNAAIALGEALSKSLTSLLGLITPIINQTTDWVQRNQGLVTAIISLTAISLAFGVSLVILGQGIRMATALLFTLIIPFKVLYSSLFILLSILKPFDAAIAGVTTAVRFLVVRGLMPFSLMLIRLGRSMVSLLLPSLMSAIAAFRQFAIACALQAGQAVIALNTIAIDLAGTIKIALVNALATVANAFIGTIAWVAPLLVVAGAIVALVVILKGLGAIALSVFSEIGNIGVATFRAVTIETGNFIQNTIQQFMALGQYIIEVAKSIGASWKELYPIISNALAGGDLETAMKGVWLGIRITWTEGINALLSLLDEIRVKVESITESIASMLPSWMKPSDEFAKAYGETKAGANASPGGGSWYGRFMRDSGIAKLLYGDQDETYLRELDATTKGIAAEQKRVIDQRRENRQVAADDLKAELEDIKSEAEMRDRLNAAIKEIEEGKKIGEWFDAQLAQVEAADKLKTLGADLITPAGAANVSYSPKALEGLSKGSMEAAKQFIESRYESLYGDTMDGILDATRRTADNTEEMGAAEGV